MFTKGDIVRIHTSSGFDEEGVPVGCTPGCRGVVIEDAKEEDGLVQLLANTHVGLTVAGYPLDRVTKENNRADEKVPVGEGRAE